MTAGAFPSVRLRTGTVEASSFHRRLAALYRASVKSMTPAKRDFGPLWKQLNVCVASDGTFPF